MAIFNIPNIAIKGLVASVPKNKVENKTYPYHSKIEKEQFEATTGIKNRRVVSKGQTALDLCIAATQRLMEELKWEPNDIQLLIFVTQTPDYKFPGNAPIAQDRLSLNKNTIAFDVNLGCSGYVYGLSIIASLLSNIKGKALLLVGDVSTLYLNEKDKTTAPLFSDAGSASAIEYNTQLKDIIFNLQTDGSGYNAIICKNGGAKNVTTHQSLDIDVKTGRRPIDMKLNGIDVFNFSRREVIPNIKELLIASDKKINEIDFLLLHQANKFMNDFIIKKLNIFPYKAPSSLEEYGNTSSASIPLTIATKLRISTFSKSKNVLLSGFGVGFSWASCIISIENLKCLELIEV